MSNLRLPGSKRKYALLLALVGSFLGVWSWSASAASSPQTISLTEVSVPKNDRALGGFSFDRAPTAGDQFVVKNALLENGAHVGHVRVLHTFITGFGPRFDRKATVLFVAQAQLPRGTLLMQGYGQVNADGPSTLRFPIVGGTGAYADARGYLDVRNRTETKTGLVFHLTP